ncbi:MAG: glycoside hydrolase family 16 protein [Hyphomonadaceae bacterium]|nr:glycoside hydrolase family 16 protein [Hyphomonadaceae bacterium]
MTVMRVTIWLVALLASLGGTAWALVRVGGAHGVAALSCRVLAAPAPADASEPARIAARAAAAAAALACRERFSPIAARPLITPGPPSTPAPPAPPPVPADTPALRRGETGALVDRMGGRWTIDAGRRNGAILRNGRDQPETRNVALLTLVDGVLHQTIDDGRVWKSLTVVDGVAVWTFVSAPPRAPKPPPPPSPLPVEGVTLDRSGLRLSFEETFDRFEFAMDDDLAPVNGHLQPWLANSHNPRDNRDNGWSRTYHKATAEEDQWYVDPYILNKLASDIPGAADFDPFSVRDGVLTITARRMPEPLATRLAQRLGRDIGWSAWESRKAWASGVLTTSENFAQTYGVWEARIRLPAVKGAWPAFWMLNRYGGWPPEIDVVDNYHAGRDANRLIAGGRITETTGFGPDDGPLGGHVFPFPIGGVYRTYAVEWTRRTITFYVDDVAFWREPTPRNFHDPMYLLINLAVIGPGANWADKPDPALDEITMDVDWVRVWRRR